MQFSGRDVIQVKARFRPQPHVVVVGFHDPPQVHRSLFIIDIGGVTERHLIEAPYSVVGRAEQQGVRPFLPDHHDIVAFAGMRNGEKTDRSAGRIVHIEPASHGSDPDDIVGVHADIPDAVAPESPRRSVDIGDFREPAGVRVVAEQSRPVDSQPDITQPVGDDAVHLLADVGAVVRTEVETAERLHFRIIYIKSGVGSYPEVAPLVLIKRMDVVVAQARRIQGIVAECLELVSVIPVESVFRAEPHESLAVLKDRRNGILGQAVFYLQVFEIERAVHGGCLCRRRNIQQEQDDFFHN